MLVVDDNLDAADSLAQLLRLDGHVVETAYAGGAAFGSWVVGFLFDRSGGYGLGLLLTAVQLLASYGLVVALGTPRVSSRRAHT